jgi:hypothetical protein
MKRYSVSIIAVVEGVVVSELEAKLSMSPGPGSRALANGTGAMVKFPSPATETSTLPEMIASCVPLVTRIMKDLKSFASLRVTLSIAVFFDTASCSIELKASDLADIAMHDVVLEVSCYPSSF